ncbi:MAG: pas/pac sensor protein, partial [Bacteroidetes bacterium]
TQRDQLSKQNKSISESILYAKRIQSAVLPPAAYINELLPENFILFKPRDEVSGDFYWIRQINQYIVIAVADCTGHGVPGAIMSMLGISFLNEIIQKREVTQANQALNELRKQIKQALRQTGKKGEADDGIDMALCALDSKTKILHYAGANNSIYLILNGELTEIKADRMPIGYYPNEKPTFTNHEIQLKDGDVFYLFSDGFMDQFGGKKGFKYKASNFQQILFENHGRPMVIQMELLEQELSNWMKGYEQTDDILVMGVRV